MEEGKVYVCEKCGGTVTLGDFPFCKGRPEDHGPWCGAEKPMEETFCEHFSTDGETFTSRRSMVRYMDKNALEPTRFRESPPGQRLYLDMGKR